MSGHCGTMTETSGGESGYQEPEKAPKRTGRDG